MWQQDLLQTMNIDDAMKQQIRQVLDQMDWERKRRQHEGIASAKERGVQFGRPRLEVRNMDKVYQMYQNNQLSVSDTARLCGVARSTMYRRLREHKERLRDNAPSTPKAGEKAI